MQYSANPMNTFSRWLTEAKKLSLENPDAMTLCTTTKNGKPSARMVLLKKADEKGFIFFTNYLSKKGQELKKNPHAAIVFYWDALQKQVRIEGKVKKISTAESEKYFHTRSLISQIGAWASKQSKPLSSREYLLNKVTTYEKKFSGNKIPLPPHWGGYILEPQTIEFWIQQKNRLHDRLFYKKKNGKWSLTRLYP